MKRHQSRNISRSRNRVAALNPCIKYSTCAGINPLADLFNRISLKLQIEGRSRESAEKQAQHQIKMKSEQKSAKARSMRKRNKV